MCEKENTTVPSSDTGSPQDIRMSDIPFGDADLIDFETEEDRRRNPDPSPTPIGD